MFRSNNEIKRTGILLLILIVLCSSISHKFYVSLTEIHFRPEKGKIEISMRIFPDDLDFAIKGITGINPQLSTELEHPDADMWLKVYLQKNFKILVNSKNIECAYIGKETESDAIWCYMEADFTDDPKDIKVKNSILSDQFKDQKNIIQVYYKKFNKGLLLDSYSSIDSLIIE